MNDDLENLKNLMRQAPEIQPGEKAKNAAFSKALDAFDKKHAAPAQGSTALQRLIRTARAGYENFFGRQMMKKSYVISGVGVFASALFGVMLYQTAQESNLANTSNLTPRNSGQNLSTTVSAVHSGNILSRLAAPMAPPQLAQAPSPAPVTSLAQDKVGTRSMANLDASMANGAAASFMVQRVGNDLQPAYYHDQGRDKFEEIKTNPIHVAKDDPVSTFSIDVDTSSYSFMRASLNNNVLPQKDAVRVEEMINYFPYDYAAPKDKEEPFATHVTVMPTPWNPQTKLVHIGIKGYQLQQSEKPHSNLVFLIDTSGSMMEPNKLPLVQTSLKMLLETLRDDDTVGIVTYAGNAGIALEPTPVKDRLKIINTIDNLTAWGSTAGAEGIRMAYKLAEQHYDKNSVNRIILTTDGDFNVGITNQDELKSFIERERDTGIYLSVLGFGMGNYNDATMQALAQNGNGNAAYIDNVNEARKALVQEAGSTLFTIAKDVKIQVEFNPAQVAEYRLIGYENRMLKREDFNNDKVDAGDIGAGHAVTAIYEITPVNSDAKLVDDLRYGKDKTEADKASGEYAFVKIRYKLPDSDTSKLLTTPVDSKVEVKDLAQAPTEARFSADVAAFGQLLRGEPYMKNFTYDDVIKLGEETKGTDSFGYRAEFINLVRAAKNAPALPTQR